MATTTANFTNLLRKRVEERLSAYKQLFGVDEIYCAEANDGAMYPHIVYTLSATDLNDWHRKDYTLDVEVYTWEDPVLMEEISDKIVDDFTQDWNDPQTAILPTFYLVGENEVEDSLKSIKRKLIRMEVQLYKR